MFDQMLKEMKRHIVSNVAVVLFTFISTFLISMGVLSFSELFGRIDRTMEEGKVPHFLQMHSGEVDEDEIREFAEKTSAVSDYQIQLFLNIDNGAFLVDGKPFITSSDDNGLTVQGTVMDFLLREDGTIPRPKNGEIYVPDYYSDKVSVGDTLTVKGRDFSVVGYIKDAQMGSSLSSSKRFLVSQSDMDEMMEYGKKEYIIEFRGEDTSSAKPISSAYSATTLPSNGPAVTWSLIRLMNALGEGMMIALIILSGLIAMAISLLALRYIILITLERDGRRSAFLNAIGYSKKEMKRRYLMKYGSFSLLGAALSFVLLPGVLSLLVHAVILMVVLLFYSLVLGRMSRMDTVSLLREEGRNENGRKGFILIVFLIAFVYLLSFIPKSVSTTLSDKDFVSSMGIGKADIRMDMKTENRDKVDEALGAMESITSYAIYDTYRLNASYFGEETTLLLESGDHSAFPVTYSSGRAPKENGEMAVSELTGLRLGDTIYIENKEYRVVGVYGDITNGGITTKVSSTFDGTPMWSIAYINSNDKEETVSSLSSLFPSARTKTIDTYVKELYGKTIEEIKKASVAALAASAAILFTLALLMLSLKIERERRSLTLKKASGFSEGELLWSMAKSLLMSLAAGVALGAVLSYIVTPILLSAFLGTLGAGRISFSHSPLYSFFILPLIVAATCALAFPLGTGGVKRIKAIEIKGGEY